jgi:hypothetical protein
LEFRQHTQTKVALWIDKNAVDLIRGYSLGDPIHQYYPIVFVGSSDPVYAFHDVLQIDSKYEGPPAADTDAARDANLIEPGFSAWIFLEEPQDREEAWSSGYPDTPSVQKILEITNMLLEGKIPDGAEK